MGRVSRTRRLRTTVRNCTRDEGGPFEAGSEELVDQVDRLLRRGHTVIRCLAGGLRRVRVIFTT